NPTNVNELSSALNDVETDINNILSGLSMVPEATPISMLKKPALDALATSLNVTTVGELKGALNTINTQVAACKAGLSQMVVPDATPVSMLPMFATLASQLSAQGYPAATMGDLRTSVPALISALEAQRASLVNNKAEIENGLADGAAQLAAGKQQIADGYQQTIDAAGKLEATIIDGRVQLEEARQELEDGIKELEENRQKLIDAEKELADGEEELEDKRADGEKELNDAKKKIEEAREDLAELEEGEWTVLDRSQHYSSATYKGTVQQMKAIGDLFPVFFILVAGLVCLTTMTRMVDEERSQIGVVRALGYNALQSASKYLIYAMSAAFIGGILGTLSGLFTYPYIIYTAWGMMYHIPPMVMDVPVKLILLANIGFILVMGLVTYSACSSNMAEAVSQLLRPKPPKNGKKIILEYIPILWNNFSFTSKVTARNIFRYKKRFFMTVIGVAGCTALLVTGFGIKDSISSIVHLQFEEIKAYDTAITMEEDVDSATLKKFEKFLDCDEVERYVKVGNYTGKVIFEDKEEAASVEVFPSAEDVTKGNLLRDRSSGELITLNDEGIILDEKMALNLGVKLGDYVKLESENEILKEVQVIGLTENYINHYVYMTQKCYEDLYGFKKEYLTYFIKNTEVNEAFDVAIAKQDGVKSISFFKGSIENFSSMIEGLDYIIIIITIAAGALAFVVLSNLTNVNISERQREIATLKVLGFNHKEVNSYIYRENLLLTFIGSLVGIPLGKLLHRFIILQVEMDYVMFGRNVALLSVLISIGITIGFAFIVNKVMTNKLKSIQMVESLKSVE
ncbi:MAG: FtsX-like permease family protein, partial [Erysipelotrichaceae bacterium]|nr:FtsX-like permease family protein [Erysipelotrichaceae bacterium]